LGRLDGEPPTLRDDLRPRVLRRGEGGAFSRLMVGPMEEAAKKRVALGRFGTPEELAGLAAFLMSPRAAWMTGEVVTLDGGEHLKSGGEFSGLVDFPRDQLKEMLRAMKPAKS